MLETDVLIVGAGPVGSTLALFLANNNVNFTIIDKCEVWSDKSKAMTMTPRTLELFQTLKVAKNLIEHGIKSKSINYYYGNHFLSRANFENLDSPYNFILQISQAKTTSVLHDKLSSLEENIQLNCEFVSFQRQPSYVVSEVRNNKSNEIFYIKSQYLVACDGGRSSVRECDGVDFDGGEYEEAFIMADIGIKNFPYSFTERHLFYLPKKSFFYVMPIEKNANGFMYRIITTMKSHNDYTDEEVKDLFTTIMKSLGMKNIELFDPKWISKFNPRQFIAENFSSSRVLYAGDAAHIQSPIGSQGLNTGIQDAFNLGWRLVFIFKHKFSEKLLEKYHEERHAVALKLFKYNDKLSNVVFGYSRFLRLFFIFGKIKNIFEKFNTKEIHLVSQFAVSYPASVVDVNDNKNFCVGRRFPNLYFHNDLSFYDLVHGRKFILFVFDNGEDIVSLLDDAAFFQDFLDIVIVTKKPEVKFTYEHVVIFDHKQQIHNKLSIKNKQACLVRPDTYIAKNLCSVNILSDLGGYFSDLLKK